VRALPNAYIIPGELTGIREILARNHVQMEIVSDPGAWKAVADVIEHVQARIPWRTSGIPGHLSGPRRS